MNKKKGSKTNTNLQHSKENFVKERKEKKRKRFSKQKLRKNLDLPNLYWKEMKKRSKKMEENLLNFRRCWSIAGC